MTFRISPAWTPKYAYPANMKAEGLQTRAFVTQWSPRGTYDDPDPHDPSWDKGYAVPQYIKDEGYGQGAKVTSWLPRGYYDGVAAQHATKIARTQQAMGDVVLPAPFSTYGRKAAAVVITRVAKLPPDSRKPMLRKILDQIDPSLWGTTERLARQHMARGVPAAAALDLALARAMSEGIAEEIVETGKRGGRPRASGQLGLGVYGRTAARGAVSLGGLLDSLTTAAKTAVQTVTASSAIVTKAPVAPPQPGNCTADGTMIWKSPDGVTFGWVRRVASDVCTGTWGSNIGGGTGGGGVATQSNDGTTVGGAGAAPEKPPADAMIQVGPWVFPKDSTYAVQRWHTKLPAEWQVELKRVFSSGGSSPVARNLVPFFDEPPATVPAQWLGSWSTRLNTQQRLGWNPIAKAKHPVTGKDYGVFVALSYADPTKMINDPTNEPTLHIVWAEVDPGWFGDFWNFIKTVLAKIVDVIGDVINVVGGLACTLLNEEGAEGAGAAVSTYYGGSPEAGKQGVQSARTQCNGQAPPPASADDWFVPAVIVGAAGLAAFYFWRKR